MNAYMFNDPGGDVGSEGSPMTTDQGMRSALYRRAPRVRTFTCSSCGRTTEIRVDGLWHGWRCGCDLEQEISCLPAGGFEVRLPEPRRRRSQ